MLDVDKLDKSDFSMFMAKADLRVSNVVKKIMLPNLKCVELSSHIKNDKNFQVKK